MQGFVQDPLITQGNLFSKTGNAILSAAVPLADSGCQSFKFDLWEFIVLADLKVSQEKVLLHRKLSTDTHGLWFGVESVASSVVDGEQLIGVSISVVVKVTDVKYLDDSQ